MQNIERKISKWQNIERQNIESPADVFLSELENREKYRVACHKITRQSKWYVNLRS